MLGISLWLIEGVLLIWILIEHACRPKPYGVGGDDADFVDIRRFFLILLIRVICVYRGNLLVLAMWGGQKAILTLCGYTGISIETVVPSPVTESIFIIPFK